MNSTKQLKVQTKLFIAYLSLTAVILVFFALFFYTYVSHQLIQQEKDSLDSTTRMIKDSTESVIQGMDTVSININYSSLVQQKLDDSFKLDISEDTFKSLAQLFVTINGTDTRADYIYLYDYSGNMLQVDTVTKFSKVDLSTLTWMDELKAMDGGKLLSQPYHKKTAGYSDWSMSLYRSFMNRYGQRIGAIETTKRCKNIFASIRSYQKKSDTSASVYVYNDRGNLLYPYDLTEEENTFPSYFEILPEDGEPITYTNQVSHRTELVTYMDSKYTGWTYVVVQKESVILKPVRDMLRILLIFTVFMLLLSAFISYKLSRSLVRPIKHLKHVIQRLQLDTLGEEKTKNYPTSVNELSELYNAFQDMSENLKTSMNELIESRQQELKSRNLALQSQINPHFYYNSLSSVIVLAESGMTEEIIQMCRNLTSIMRYITDHSSVPVTLKEEVDYVNRYLYCMKVRYQSSLNYSVEIPDSLMERKVPKLLLQPLVENALKYGTNCNPPWSIRLSGSDTPEGWQIDVIDSGEGFSEEAISKINQRISEAVKNPGLPEMHINGLGMVNVYLRWRLFCGDSILFTYGNTEDGHGKVSIGCRKKNEEN